jgi:site-specific recombinase XerC
MESRVREFALFNLGIDSKLHGCDLVALKVRDVCYGDTLATRAIVMQHKTQRPGQFEITQATRDALQTWIKQAGLKQEDRLSVSQPATRLAASGHPPVRSHPRTMGR